MKGMDEREGCLSAPQHNIFFLIIPAAETTTSNQRSAYSIDPANPGPPRRFCVMVHGEYLPSASSSASRPYRPLGDWAMFTNARVNK